MDDLIQVLFFIATLGFFIFSAFRKQKKHPNQQGNQSGIFDNSIESLFGIPVVEDTISSGKEIESEKSYRTKPVANASNEKISEMEPKKELIEEQSESDESNNFSESFDLRSAVIYTEILNRKHF